MPLSKDKVIVTCALTGVLAKRDQCPYLPYSPVEIAEEARRAYEAGAAVVHIHGREPDSGDQSWSADIYGQIKEEVRKRSPIIINFSTGGFNMGVASEAEKKARLAYVCEDAAGDGRAQHGVDELREVLGEAEGVRLRLRVPQPLLGHPAGSATPCARAG